MKVKGRILQLKLLETYFGHNRYTHLKGDKRWCRNWQYVSRLYTAVKQQFTELATGQSKEIYRRRRESEHLSRNLRQGKLKGKQRLITVYQILFSFFLYGCGPNLT